eukprot:8385605-Pyramimonas_sp.AAC.1
MVHSRSQHARAVRRARAIRRQYIRPRVPGCQFEAVATPLLHNARCMIKWLHAHAELQQHNGHPSHNLRGA